MHGRLHLKKGDLVKIINDLDVAVWIIDLNTREAFFSEGFNKIFGRSPEDFYQDADLWIKVLHPKDACVAKIRKIKKQQREKTIDEYRILKPNGEIR